ncbi:hypothetical protein EPO04_01040 [Patescibacteria group bacterium]|nr:MAG: hypothetical protein EPO04_01040 [Patescibacteria group bacterium]
MSERCQNCDSTDIVEIQGQKFCINCGEPYTAPAGGSVSVKPAVKKQPDPVAVATPVAIKSATGAGKPKAVKKPVAAKPKAPIEPKLKEVKVTKRAEAEVKAVPVKSAAATDSALDLRYSTTAQPAAARATHQPVAPIAPPAQKQAETKLDEPNQSTKEHKLQPPTDTKPHPFGFSFKVATLVAVPLAAIFGAMVWFLIGVDIVLYAVVAAALLIFAVLTLAQSAILYGMSRASDHRPVERRQWWSAARSGFMDVVNINLMTVIVVIITVSLAAAGWQGVGRLGLPDWAETGLLLALNAVAAWLLLGALVSRHIAIPAAIIGGMSSTQTYKLGWRTFAKAGGSLSLALIRAWITGILVVVGAAIAVIYLNQHFSEYNHLTVTLLVAAATWLFITLLFVTSLQLESRMWLRQYRYWVARCFPSRQLRLLAGRVQTLRHR